MNKFFILVFLMLMIPNGANAVPPIPGPVNLCKNPEFDSYSLNVNGLRRDYCIHIPSFPINNLPVILAFHGGNQTPKDQIDIWRKHTEQGMVIVAPKALEREDSNGQCKRMWRSIGGGIKTWDAYLNPPGLCTAEPGAQMIDERNDLDFIKELMEDLSSRLNVSGFYATGFSSGGGMTYQLYITKQFVKRIKGFAVVSNTIKQDKKIAATQQGWNDAVAILTLAGKQLGYSANLNVARPFMYIMGTADKVNAPTESILNEMGNCPTPIPPAPCAGLGVNDHRQCVMRIGLQCWRAAITAGNSHHRMKTPREDTMLWLVQKNGSNRNPINSLYPNLGSFGRIPQGSNVDTTAVIRQDFVADSEGAEPVSVITVLDGGHVWPGGKSGNQAPCMKNNCDIDASNEILQFWRANAGFPRP